MNPRRSSRARPNPAPTAMQPTNSTSSSTSAGRAERSTRSNNKASPSRRASTQQRSQSIDDPAVSGQNEPRHKQRGRDGDRNNHIPPANDEYDEEEGDEEEITRCVCGQQDYPGLPVAARELLTRSSAKAVVKEELIQRAAAAASDPLADEPGSLFIQCDSCKVWQHGGCVGIMDEQACPEEYFCEECRKDLHKIVADANGHKSSHYIPVVGPQSPTPSSSSRDNSRNSRKPRDKKSKADAAAAAAAASAKRRSTMNSRDAAYDEEEQLRRAIEESKEDNKSVSGETGSKKGKRSRSDSDVNKQSAKRQRTGSMTPSSTSKLSQANSQMASDDDTKSKASVNGSNKKTRASAARNQREKDGQTEKEAERDPIPEAAGRRKGRSERRKGDVGSEPPDTSPVKPTSNTAQSAPDTPEVAQEPTSGRTSTRKTGRPARRGRVGRNQYTRDRDVNGGESNYANGNSPRRGQSRDDANGDSPPGGHMGPNGVYLNGGESGRPSRPRYMNPNRTSMNDMRKRVAAILEFISRMQVEMAASGEQVTPPNGENGSNGGEASADSSNNKVMEAAVSLVEGVIGDPSELMVNGDTTKATTQDEDPTKGRDFKDLSSVEMMDVLTRGLLKWQQEYGKYGDK